MTEGPLAGKPALLDFGFVAEILPVQNMQCIPCLLTAVEPTAGDRGPSCRQASTAGPWLGGSNVACAKLQCTVCLLTADEPTGTAGDRGS